MSDKKELSDEKLVEKILQGETALYAVLTQRYTRRLYRTARAVLCEESEAEEVMQHAFLQAFQHLKQFAGRAKFSSWLTTIAVNQARLRRRQRRRYESLEQPASDGHGPVELVSSIQNPEQHMAALEFRRLLESAIDALPQQHRLILVMRDVEDMSTAETVRVWESVE